MGWGLRAMQGLVPKFVFLEMGIPEGSVLHLTNNPEIRVQVLDSRHVSYLGSRMSLTKVTTTLLGLTQRDTVVDKRVFGDRTLQQIKDKHESKKEGRKGLEDMTSWVVWLRWVLTGKPVVKYGGYWCGCCGKWYPDPHEIPVYQSAGFWWDTWGLCPECEVGKARACRSSEVHEVRT